MALAGTLQSLDMLKDESGLTDADIAYLTAKGYKKICLFARAATSMDKMIERVVEPYVAGVFIEAAEYKSVRDAELTETVVVVEWDEAKSRRDRELAMAAAVPLPTPSPVHHAAAVPAGT